MIAPLVNEQSNPPVCKLDDFGTVLKKEREKEKEKKVNQKARTLKEMFVGAGIDPHDLGIKMNKVKEFLAEGHPVKVRLCVAPGNGRCNLRLKTVSLRGVSQVVVTAKKLKMKANPLCVEETTMNVLEAVESHVSNVQQPDSSSPSRRDFTLNPKSQKS